jgi:hypothetical protein
MPDYTTLTEVITECHQELDEFFLRHQEAVLMARFDDALQVLDCFAELHHLHMTFEDEKLIPKLGELGDPGRWRASLYADEHGKVQQLLEKTRNSLQLLSQQRLSPKNQRREIIAFIDKEKTLKGVCEHHQEREETGLLPELDQATGLKWRADAIGPFLQEWTECMKRNTRIIAELNLL